MHAATFHPFPRLPKELRLEIWRLALPNPRLIQCTVNYLKEPWSAPELKWAAKSEPLSSCLRQVSSEASEVFRKAYCVFDISDRIDGLRTTRTQVDYDRDAFYFPTIIPGKRKDDSFSSALAREGGGANGMEKAKIVVLDLNVMQKPFYRSLEMYKGLDVLFYDARDRAVRVIEEIASVFPELERLYFVVDPKAAAPVNMIDPLESEEYVRWHKVHGPQIVDWIPGTTAELRMKRGISRPLTIGLKLFVEASTA